MDSDTSPEFGSKSFEIPSGPEEVVNRMMDEAIGLDNPITPEAFADAKAQVAARLDKTQAWLEWQAGDPPPDPNDFDPPAIMALLLDPEESPQSE